MSTKLFCGAAAAIAIAATSSVHGEPLDKRAPSPGPLPVQYNRENSLALCEWGDPYGPRSLLPFLYDLEGQGYGSWTCRLPGVAGDDKCTFSGAPDWRPTNATYWVVPRDQAHNYTESLAWADGSGLYAVWGMRCARAKGTGPARDRVVETNVDGHFVPGSEHGPMNACHVTILADVDGGVVEHVRPGLVRGTVKIALAPKHMDREANDLTIAIQALSDTGWQDVATTVATVERDVRTFEVSATVAELTDVRLQVRGDRCYHHLGVGYDLRDARIFVETCIPDQNEPGTCLGD